MLVKRYAWLLGPHMSEGEGITLGMVWHDNI